MLTRCRSFLVSKFLVSKFWWQNLSFIENLGDKICLHGSHEWSKSNTSLSLMQAECSMSCWAWILTKWKFTFVDLLMIFDRVLMSFDIVVSFLTLWFHFWHVQLQVMFTVFFLSFIFVVRDFIYDFISDFIYDFINCQSCLRLHCTNVGYI